MKRIIYLLAILPIFLLWGCDSDTDDIVTPDPPIVNGGDIEFNIGFAPQVQTRVATDADFKSTWEDGDQVGIFAVKRASSETKALAVAGNYMQNVKLTYNKTDDKWTTASDLWHASGSDVLDFYAYYPYDAQATDPTAIAFAVKTDQSIEANYNASDLLSANTKNIAKGTASVDLTFSHKLALVQVEIDLGTIKGSGPTEELALTLRSCKAGGAFNLGSGSLTTAGDAVAVKMLRVEKSGDADFATKYTYRALVPAQDVASGKSLYLMSQNGQLYSTPNLAAALDLTAGDAKRYTATLPASAIQTVKIPNGSFLMGSSDGSNTATGTAGVDPNATPTEPNRYTDETQHKVTLTKDYYMSKYQIINAQYAAFLNANAIGSDGKWSAGHYPNEILIYASSGSYDWGLHYNTDKWEPVSGYDNHPVISVTWFGAKAYADWIGGSLPTEAQWEYACRGGKANHPFGIGTGYALNNTDANFNWGYSWSWDGTSATATIGSTGTSPGRTTAVGSYTANNYGLYDMHGNVWEWCSDKCDWPIADYGNTAVTDPTGSETGNFRVLRGGGWRDGARYCRSAGRNSDYPGIRGSLVGFRVVFVP